MRYLERLGPSAQDALLAGVVAVMLTVNVLVGSPHRDPAGLAIDLVAVLAGSLALAAWRRAPLLALAGSTAAMLGYAVHAQPGPPAAFPVMISVFGAVRYGHRLLPALAAAVFLGANLAKDLATVTDRSDKDILQATILLLGWFVASGVAATVTRHRQAYLEQAEQRAAEAERTREEVARRRAGEERLRIARELHDSLTHSISVIKVQAGVAVHLARKRGEEVPAALLAIQEASGDAMRELRATLEVLRDDSAPPPDPAPAHAPALAPEECVPSGLDRLDDLVRRARSIGLPTTVTVAGARRALPPEVDRAAYRIVQEALTNVSRHAGAAAAQVRVEYADAELVVQVDDDGSASAGEPPVPGTGLRGMRERVSALGGRLRTEPRPEGGFTVHAALPLREPA
ncbi:sensor histidine kinase [Nonomuraea wenchangensis]|uniref:histidine kinase n=1 Tax=Nonomuraea wenchangensis TaxID=568860 RepID=A0A1I0L2D5_9ACTN|nr:sensor histidine kinase [Nonomuraea wenchangensis]SEU33236.1 Histidine kinase [Nonomuraea wenchangensis]